MPEDILNGEKMIQDRLSTSSSKICVWSFVACVLLCPGILSAQTTLGGPVSSTGYHVAGRFPIGGESGWDYISLDGEAKRVYVSHGKQVEVLDEDSGKSIGVISDTPGVHGIALAPELKRGFVSNGGDKSVTIFNTDTLETIKKVPVNNPDFILYDPFTKRVFPMNEKITVLDAISGDKVGEIDLWGDPEAAASDGKGRLYVNLADKGAVAIVDAQSLEVAKTYPIEDCKRPHSMAFDSDSQRLFVGCRDGSLAVVDANSGKIVDRSLMCSGVDAGAYDEKNKLVFESCSEGVISVIKEVVPGDYELIDTIKTQLFARTLAFDSKTLKIFLPTADIQIVSTSDPKKPYKNQIRPDSFRVLVVEP